MSSTKTKKYKKETNRNAVSEKTMTELNNTKEGFNITFEQTEERTSKLIDRTFEIIKSEKQKIIKLN